MGDDRQQFDLHKELICSRSLFFEAACRNGFKEAAEGKVELPEQEAPTFQYFVHWLYSSRLGGYHDTGFSAAAMKEYKESTALAESTHNRHGGVENQENAVMARRVEEKAIHTATVREYPFLQLVALYVLADSLQVRGLKDEIVTKLFEIYAMNKNVSKLYWDPVTAFNLAYEKLPDSSPLREFLVALHVYKMKAESKANRSMYNHEFLCDALDEVLRNWKNGPKPPKWDDAFTVCAWHEHDVEKCSVVRAKEEGVLFEKWQKLFT